MNSDILLSIILPAHNETERLPDCIKKVSDFVEKSDFMVEVIIVENGSRDDTYKVAQSYAQHLPWLKVLKSEESGKGCAVRMGMLAAKGQYRFFADVDFSMPVEEIRLFIPPVLSDYAVAIGSREAPGSVRYNEPQFRHFTGRVFNWFVQLLTVRGLKDTQCGFKCFSADAAMKIFPLQQLNGWAFDVEILYIAQRNGLEIIEIPVHWYYDGDSKVSVLRDSIRMFQELLQIRKNGKAGIYDIHP